VLPLVVDRCDYFGGHHCAGAPCLYAGDVALARADHGGLKILLSNINRAPPSRGDDETSMPMGDLHVGRLVKR
jgi:hypothetical protein